MQMRLANMLNALVVEDEEDIRRLLAAELADRGYRVREAHNGVIAIQRVREEIPDIIFVDILMPVMDGFDFISTLRENPETTEIPVVLVSALNPQETRGQPNQMGLKFHLTKPWESWALDIVLNRIFNPG